MPVSIPADATRCLHHGDGMFLTSGLMTLEQRFLLNWNALQNRLLYTPGVLEGLAVTHGGGNRLTVGSGAGFDAVGRFLVLPGEGASLTVPGGSSASCYIHLLFPDPAPVGKDGTTMDLAASSRIGDTDEVPDNGVLLAEIRRDAAGAVVGVIDRRQPVRSRLPAQLTDAG
ncbi:hypothetical protein D9623_01440 [Azospirillum brasilense]|uniref:Uncharacterized protein n=1 Tax=Azospirillum brasilense TaxID=192 RepID=A0A0P0EPW6_AZOBR|nr:MULTISPECIES: hypothetical protein [Azospirillum]ALJ34068.1 hypothetical protein AMK58_00785 [Azospirillum brasilense]MDW7552963.1 hypothetical protein [Azospirillum brasilense]MDW7591845.1 hypothetical protein [Azospirillum brasilense]MDW7627878.1 hypothetical protein [Azospirillum brasilense]MDX5952653.1 hypothetical protein [Azospirillum brasilense]